MTEPQEEIAQAGTEAGGDGRSGELRPSITIETQNIAVKTGVTAGGDGGGGDPDPPPDPPPGGGG